MPNIQSVQIKILSGVVQSGAAVNYDLSCGSPEVAKRLSSVNVLVSGTTFMELPYPVAGSVLMTKIFNCDGTYDYALDEICDLQKLLIDSSCEPKQLGEDCSKPLKVEICGANTVEIELGGYEACYNGIPAHIEIIRDELQVLVKYVAHLKDGSGTIIDPATPTSIGTCPVADETDLIKTNWLPICVNGVQWYVGEQSTFNNTTNVESTPVKVYKQGANGVITTIAPVGSIVEGECDSCKKEIFATHDRFYPSSVGGVAPANKEGFDFDLPTDFGTTDATDTYFHILQLSTSYYYPPATTNPTTPIVIDGNVAAINTFIKNSLIADGLTGNEFEIVVNANKTITVWKDVSYTSVGDEFWWGTSTPDNYTNKLFPAIPTVYPYPSGGCIVVQEIKEKDSCTGEETYRYVIEDGNGLLVKASSIIPNFDETLLTAECTATPAVKQDAQVPNCAGTLDAKPVDSIVGAYILNQENKHTEKVYDVLTAVTGGTIAYTYTAPLDVALSYSAVTLANDTIRYFWTDFGDGYSDIGPSPSHAYNSDGNYEIKSYVITRSGNKILLAAKEVTIINGVITYTPTTLPQTVFIVQYKVVVGTALQDYCNKVLVGTPYNTDGSDYTLIGDLQLETPNVIDDLEDNGDFKVSTSAPTVTAVTPVYSTNRTLQTANTVPATYNVAAIANSREITVQNLTNSDVQITTLQGTQIVATRGVITLSNPTNTTVNHNAFTGNIAVAFLSNVGGNIGGVAPRIIINQKAY